MIAISKTMLQCFKMCLSVPLMMYSSDDHTVDHSHPVDLKAGPEDLNVGPPCNSPAGFYTEDRILPLHRFVLICDVPCTILF